MNQSIFLQIFSCRSSEQSPRPIPVPSSARGSGSTMARQRRQERCPPFPPSPESQRRSDSPVPFSGGSSTSPCPTSEQPRRHTFLGPSPGNAAWWQRASAGASEPPSASWGRVTEWRDTLPTQQTRAAARGSSSPRACCSNRTCHFATFGRLLGDAQEGVGTRRAGPQEADRVCLGSLGRSAACWSHTPCVSVREARRTFLPCLLFSLPSGAGPRRCPEKSPPRTCLVGRNLQCTPGALCHPSSTVSPCSVC